MLKNLLESFNYFYFIYNDRRLVALLISSTIASERVRWANNTDWDWWLGLTFTKQNRHVIVPEVSRTFHAGSAGAHVTGWEQAFFYDQMIYNQNPDVKIRNIHHKVWGENITLMDPSDDIIDLAERRDFMWRSANHSGNYLLRQKAFNDEEEFAMTNTRVGKRNFKSYL
ncbi:Protein O-linked-mannose beta-1,2-N-acetylglucosaminyltransferase 1 [Armadillidium vulgare]|nr:Protein O-linked-mannose beta-1,2-N-acetylglucosaminyltransferase 1 [Armadillidium vulgare]